MVEVIAICLLGDCDLNCCLVGSFLADRNGAVFSLYAGAVSEPPALYFRPPARTEHNAGGIQAIFLKLKKDKEWHSS